MGKITVAVVVLAGSVTAPAEVIYVDADAPGANDGSSWADAYNYLQDGLADAAGGDEIRVAQGIYRPDQGGSNTPGDRRATFQLTNGVILKGSYTGFGQPEANARDIDLYETILSGDLNGDDGPNFANNGENSFHIIVITNMSFWEEAVLDGLTITAGNANADYPGDDSGGGVYSYENHWKNSIFINCSFRNNSAYAGGAIYNSSSPVLVNCKFRANRAYAFGGGMYNNGYAFLTNCIFAQNSCGTTPYGSPRQGQGGAISIRAGRVELRDCRFTNNSAGEAGGAIEGDYSRLFLDNCIFTGNLAGQGGAIETTECYIKLVNCTFAGNLAPHGINAVECRYEPHWGDVSNVKIRNCILWNSAREIGGNEQDPTIEIIHSNVQGGWPGEGNINVDPCFTNPGYWGDPCNTPNRRWDDVWIDGDYHLKSQAGRWESATQAWIVDDVTSPCIDAGDMSSPIGYEPFPNGGIVNMGAYGGTAEASKSYFGEPVCDTIVAGDINGDCVIDLRDFCIMALRWCEDSSP